MSLSLLTCIQALVSAFLAVLFLQSGIDKIVDRKGNLTWLEGHFAASPLTRVVPQMLATVTLVELAAGAISAAGVVGLVLFDSRTLAVLGVGLSAVALLMLFFGQRMAKDYDGAAVLVNYFLLALAGLYLLR